MSTTKKIFSVAILKIGDAPFTTDTFSPIKADEVDNFEVNGEIQHNKIVKKEVKDNRFVLIYFEEGETIPRPDLVYNRTTQSDEDNPRSIDQIERDSQTFILVDVQTQKIFISDFRKKKTLEEWLGGKTRKTVIIKNIIGRDNFLDEIRSINTIYLSAIPNLFSRMGILNQELTNDHHNYGVAIKHIGVKISFDDNNVPELLKNKILALFSQKDNDSIQSLMVSGRYDEKFERVFNAEGIVDKVTIETILSDNGLFDKDQVFNNLIQKIQ